MDNKTNDGITILVVEDDEVLNKSIRKLLDREGLESEGFLTGAQVLARLSIASGDLLLLLDYSLPDMAGKEIIAVLRARNLEIPFVIITGHGDEQLAVEMMKLGALDYVVKSLQFNDVMPAKIKHICREIANRKKLAIAESAVRQADAALRESDADLRKAQEIAKLVG
jgi:FixJ family two-component response regulator